MTKSFYFEACNGSMQLKAFCGALPQLTQQSVPKPVRLLDFFLGLGLYCKVNGLFLLCNWIKNSIKLREREQILDSKQNLTGELAAMKLEQAILSQYTLSIGFEYIINRFFRVYNNFTSIGYHLILNILRILIIFTVAGCDDLCGNEVLNESISPSSNYIATVFERSCGATTPKIRIVSLRKIASNFMPSNYENWIFTIHEQSDIHLHWIGNNELKVSFPPTSDKPTKITQWNDVSIIFSLSHPSDPSEYSGVLSGAPSSLTSLAKCRADIHHP